MGIVPLAGADPSGPGPDALFQGRFANRPLLPKARVNRAGDAAFRRVCSRNGLHQKPIAVFATAVNSVPPAGSESG